MHSLSPDFLSSLRYDGLQMATLRSIGEYQGKQQLYFTQSPEALSGLRKIAVMESTESSNRLEGVVVAKDRLKSLAIKNASPKSRSEQEIAGYRDALALVHEPAEHMPFSENMIMQLHAMLYRYMPQPGGHWKASNNDIIEKHPDSSSQMRFQPVAAHLTPMAMGELAGGYTVATSTHLADPLVLVPLCILDFLCVHPFADGNGRMARLLTLLLLYQHEYAVGRYISLERIFEESKESYFETLEVSSQGWHEGKHDVRPWLNYFWGALLRAHKEFEECVGDIERGRGAKGDRVRNEILKRTMPFSISDIENACPGISRDMVRLVLRAMKAEGIIAPTGKGRGAQWQRLLSGSIE
ncbi:MAG: Fic family protein [Betaproteobacteria bacterium]|nr:Fic family protein [Betaproteobacteria bacterium]